MYIKLKITFSISLKKEQKYSKQCVDLHETEQILNKNETDKNVMKWVQKVLKFENEYPPKTNTFICKNRIISHTYYIYKYNKKYMYTYICVCGIK